MKDLALGFIAATYTVLIIGWLQGCGGPFLRCKELEIGKGQDAGQAP